MLFGKATSSADGAVAASCCVWDWDCVGVVIGVWVGVGVGVGLGVGLGVLVGAVAVLLEGRCRILYLG